MYEYLTDYIPQIKDIEYGKRYPEKQMGDGSLEHPFQMPFIIYNDIVDGLVREVYRFEEEHPEYGLNRYHGSKLLFLKNVGKSRVVGV